MRRNNNERIAVMTRRLLQLIGEKVA
jgi:hypothetical protein